MRGHQFWFFFLAEGGEMERVEYLQQTDSWGECLWNKHGPDAALRSLLGSGLGSFPYHHHQHQHPPTPLPHLPLPFFLSFFLSIFPTTQTHTDIPQSWGYKGASGPNGVKQTVNQLWTRLSEGSLGGREGQGEQTPTLPLQSVTLLPGVSRHSK